MPHTRSYLITSSRRCKVIDHLLWHHMLNIDTELQHSDAEFQMHAKVQSHRSSVMTPDAEHRHRATALRRRIWESRRHAHNIVTQPGYSNTTTNQSRMNLEWSFDEGVSILCEQSVDVGMNMWRRLHFIVVLCFWVRQQKHVETTPIFSIIVGHWELHAESDDPSTMCCESSVKSSVLTVTSEGFNHRQSLRIGLGSDAPITSDVDLVWNPVCWVLQAKINDRRPPGITEMRFQMHMCTSVSRMGTA